MLTDEQVEKLNRRLQLRLRNLTPQQWADIAAMLPKPPTRKACALFLEGVNYYWLEALAPAVGKRIQLTGEAAEAVRVAINKLRTARPYTADMDLAGVLTQLSEIHQKIQHMATVYGILTWGPVGPLRARHYRPRAFLEDALDLWVACGGERKFSRDKVSGTPGGPLVRYLQFVTGLVMQEKAPALGTLADFIAKQRAASTLY